MYKIIEEIGDKTRIEVTHTCGHVQVDLPKTQLLQKGEERFPGFTHRQYSFLAQNLCPGCYCAEKERNPDLKPIGG